MPSSGRGLKSGGFMGYAHTGGSSAPHVGGAAEKMDTSESARIRMNVLMFPSPPPRKRYRNLLRPNAGPEPRARAAARDERSLLHGGSSTMLAQEARPPRPRTHPY